MSLYKSLSIDGDEAAGDSPTTSNRSEDARTQMQSDPARQARTVPVSAESKESAAIKRSEKYLKIMFNFKVDPCTITANHDFKTCKFYHPKNKENDRRRDPRRRGINNQPINQPPWAYGVTDDISPYEKKYHPDKYKTERCKTFLAGQKCIEPHELCPFLHTSPTLNFDADLAYATPWRVNISAFDWEFYLDLMLNYKIDGPCPKDCASQTDRVKCMMWHKTDMDRRYPVHCTEKEWLPVNITDLSRPATSYDPRVYKSKLCVRVPNCVFGVYCTYAHSEEEKQLAGDYRDRLRQYLLSNEQAGPRYAPLPALAPKEKRLVVDPPQVVCRICWNATAKDDMNGKRNQKPTSSTKCRQCGSEFSEIEVYQCVKDPSRWVHIRPMPDIPTAKIVMCKDRKDNKSCQRGATCSFAHSEEELVEWSTKQQSDRPDPHDASMQLLVARVDAEREWKERPCPNLTPRSTFSRMCNNVKNCPYSTGCNFPHTPAELAEWELRLSRLKVLQKGCGYLTESSLTHVIGDRIGTIPSAVRGVQLVLDSPTSYLQPLETHVFETHIAITSGEAPLTRIGVLSACTSFRILSVEQGPFRFPIINESDMKGECQALTTIGGTNAPVVIKVFFGGVPSGSQQAFLVAELGTRTFIKLDLIANLVADDPRVAGAALAASAVSAINASVGGGVSGGGSGSNGVSGNGSGGGLLIVEPPTEDSGATLAANTSERSNTNAIPSSPAINGTIPVSSNEVLAYNSSQLSRSNYRAMMHSFLKIEHQAIDHRLPLATLLEQPAMLCSELEHPFIRADREHTLVCIQVRDRVDDLSIVQRGDLALLTFSIDPTPRVALVQLLQDNRLVLRLPTTSVPQVVTSHVTVTVTFRADPSRRVAMHEAIDRVNLDLVLPNPAPAPQLFAVPQRFDSQLAEEQIGFVNMVTSGFANHMPLVLLGHSLSGRTSAVVESVKLIVTNTPTARVLIATHSTDAAMQLMTDHFIPFFLQHNIPTLYVGSPSEKYTVPNEILPYAAGPATSALIQSHNIVVCSFANARYIASDTQFNIVFLDDVSRAREIDVLGALSLAQSAVLVGQPFPFGVVFPSITGFKNGRMDSLVQRIATMYYSSDVLNAYLVHLCRVYCESAELLGQLVSGAPDLPPLTKITALFYASSKAETQLSDSPGYVNEEELSELEHLIPQFKNGWQAEWGPFDPSQFAVAVPYEAQAVRLREILAQHSLNITIGLPSSLKDGSYRALIISTVRTAPQVSDNRTNQPFVDDLSLADDACTLRMLFARARSVVAVVGHPATLLGCTSDSARELWSQYIAACRRTGTMFNSTEQDLLREKSDIQRLYSDAFFGVSTKAGDAHVQLNQALGIVGPMLWTYLTTPCNLPPNHSAVCMGYHSQSECRRDPRRRVDGEPLMYGPPWAYSLQECQNDAERAYHPDNYKTKPCSRKQLSSKCNDGPRCSKQHEDQLDHCMNTIRKWWHDLRPISKVEYMGMTQAYKREAAGICCLPDHGRCYCYHNEQDKCAPLLLSSTGDWVPAITSLTPYAALFDIRKYKMSLCPNFPSCSLRFHCPHAHGAAELATARTYRRESHIDELLKMASVKALLDIPRVMPIPLPAFVPSQPPPPNPPNTSNVAAYILHGGAPNCAWLGTSDMRSAIVMMLQSGVEAEQLLFDSVYAQCTEAVQLLVREFNANVNRVYAVAVQNTSQTFTLLHYVCEGGLLAMVPVLRAVGADTTLLDCHERTALDSAVAGLQKRIADSKNIHGPDRVDVDQRIELCKLCIRELLQT